jgi:hypothetical protein
MAIIIKVSLKDVNYQPVIDAVCANKNYQETIDDGSGLNVMIPNPQTKEQFVIKHIKKMLLDEKRLYENAISVEEYL